MRCLHLLPLCIALLLKPAHAAAPLRVGGFLVAPFVTGNSNEPLRGALRAFLEQKVNGRAGLELQWTAPTTVPRARENIKSGAIDVLLLTSSAQGETAGIVRANWSYLRSHPHLAVLPQSPLTTVQSLQELAGMSIGWVSSGDLPSAIATIPIQWQFLTLPDWQSINLRKLQAGRIQAVYFQNEYSPRYYAAREHVAIRLVKLPMPEVAFMMAYSAKADREAIARFDKLAADAFAGDQFRQFLEHYVSLDRADDGAH